jgi:hypothetical protein
MRRVLPWVLVAILVAVVVFASVAMLRSLGVQRNAARQVGVHLHGYHTSTNGYRVARFSITNGNSFPVRCRFWATPPNSTDFRAQRPFDPEYEIIPARSDLRVEGALRPRFPLTPPYPPGTNLPPSPWVLHVAVWDARPPNKVSPVRQAASELLFKVHWNRPAWFLSPGKGSTTESDVLPPDTPPHE